MLSYIRMLLMKCETAKEHYCSLSSFLSSSFTRVLFSASRNPQTQMTELLYFIFYNSLRWTCITLHVEIILAKTCEMPPHWWWGEFWFSPKLTLWDSAQSSALLEMNSFRYLKAQTGFFLSFLFLFLHTCCFSLSPLLSCLVLWSPLVVDFHPPCPTLSLLSVHPSLPAALWPQSVMGLGCRRTVEAPPCPSSSSAPLHLCCPFPKGPAQSIFTQVKRRAETQRRLTHHGGQTLILFLIHISFFKTQLSESFRFLVCQFLAECMQLHHLWWKKKSFYISSNAWLMLWCVSE